MVDTDLLARVAAYGFGAGTVVACVRYLGKRVDELREDFIREMAALRTEVRVSLGGATQRLDDHANRISGLEAFQRFMSGDGR